MHPSPDARLGYCCKFVPPDGDPALAAAMNTGTTTVTHLRRIGPSAAHGKLLGLVGRNVAALRLQVARVAGLPPLRRLLRLPSDLLPAYTHPEVAPLYRHPEIRGAVESGLAALGAQARAGDVRVSFHPDQFCVLASANPAAAENGLREFEYHAEAMALMGYHGSWHPHGAHVNVHGGGRAGGVEGIRAGLARLSAQARNLVTLENDEVSYGLDDLLALADAVPVVLDLHHHWVASRGEWIGPDDPRVARVAGSWRGVRPVAHVSVCREGLLPARGRSRALPRFDAAIAAGATARDLRAHADLMWNGPLNDLVAAHLTWADFEVEAKSKNLASDALAGHVLQRAEPQSLAA